MWAEAKALHDAGRIRAVEVRGSDYVGTGVGGNGHVTRQIPGALKGKRAWVFNRKDVPHTFTDVLDTARLLIAAAEDETALGRTWHVPSNPPRTQEQAINDVLRSVGKPAVKVSAVPMPVFVRAWRRSCRSSASCASCRTSGPRRTSWTTAPPAQHFGMEPTPWDEVCRRSAVL